MQIHRVEDLDVFKKSHRLALDLYKITNSLPASELYGLTSQIRRASISINANLMEGGHRNNRKEYRQFVGIARGSCGELKYHILMLKDLGYINDELYRQYAKELEMISKKLFNLANKLSEEIT